MSQHVFEYSGAPSAAPNKVGAHWVDTSSGDHYIAVGTSSVDDWVRTCPMPLDGNFRVKNENFQVYNPDQTKYHTVYIRGAAGSEYWVIGPGES